MVGLGPGPHEYDTASSVDVHSSAVALTSVGAARYTLVAIFLYDWAVWYVLHLTTPSCTSLNQFHVRRGFSTEVELVHRSRWTPVKAAYLFCRYYPILVGPLFLWAFILDHGEQLCMDVFRPIYFCLIPVQMAPQLILVLRAYAFTGRKRGTLILLGFCLFSLFAASTIVFAHDLVLSTPLFEAVERSGCFAMTDVGSDIGGWHLGAIFSGVFVLDALNVFIVIRHSIKDRATLGSLGEAFLKQGVIVYVCMTVVNIVSAVMYYIPARELNGIGSWLAWLLPSVLVNPVPTLFRATHVTDVSTRGPSQACRLVLVLRRKASPTQSEVMHQMSVMVNQALELVPVASSDDSVTRRGDRNGEFARLDIRVRERRDSTRDFHMA
ncbi:hypothetical protein OF83DRAFT_1167912 [Amylostereum chailletii]|nr:hypothetical protein OF83DRAFT_1167912 [Amylostereum chailletii]